MGGIGDAVSLPSKSYGALVRYAKSLAVALSERDPCTRLHCERVMAISTELGRFCGLPADERKLLRIAAALHDIGKIGIPDRVLHKPGGLDEQEWGIMKTHPERGQRILASIELAGTERIGLIIRHHHEHYDGNGYPDGLAGESIPALARILALADSYDAMVTPRVYQRAKTHREIMEILDQEQGRKHDPYLFAKLARLIETRDFGAQGA
jgi:HD-GYP domain-containing protein (c-di-GMP phosphodiesterase class II)